VKQSQTVVISGSSAFEPTSQSRLRLSPSLLLSDAKELWLSRPEFHTALPWPSWRMTRVSPASPSTSRRAALGGKGLVVKGSRVQQNDVVLFANRAGMWKVVAPVNGSKADIRRSEGFDTRIITAPLETLTVVQRAGSPGYSY
jgi:hypothetical protein